MRPHLLVVIAALASCDQLGPPSLESGANASRPIDEPVAAKRWRVQWTTPHGGIELTTNGKVSVKPEHGAPIDAIHVRVALSSSVGWVSADLSDAKLETPDTAVVRPFAVNASIPTLPIAVVLPGASQAFDLYFPLPARAGAALTFGWKLGGTNGPVVLGAVLDLAAEPASYTTPTGEKWWFRASYPWSTYRHQDGRIVPLPPTSADVEVQDLSGKIGDENPCDEW